MEFRGSGLAVRVNLILSVILGVIEPDIWCSDVVYAQGRCQPSPFDIPRWFLGCQELFFSSASAKGKALVSAAARV